MVVCPDTHIKYFYMKHIKYLWLFFFLSLIVSCEKEIDYSITVDYSELTLKTGESYTIVAKVTPASSDGIVWTSSNESVATVFYGIITAKKEGEAIITATSNGESASCKVNVQNPGYSLVWSDEFETNSLNTKNWNIDCTYPAYQKIMSSGLYEKIMDNVITSYSIHYTKLYEHL